MVRYLHLNEFCRVMGLMGQRLWVYGIALIVSCSALAAYEIINGYVNRDLVNAAINREPVVLWQTVIFAVIAFLLTNVILDPVARYVLRRSIRQTVFDIRMRVFAHVERLPMAYFDAVHSGEIMSKMNNDLSKIEAVYGDNLHRVVMMTMQGVGATVTMFVLEWRLALITVTIGLIAALVNVIYARPMRKFSDAIQRQLGVSTGYFIDLFSGIQLIKMFHIGEILLDKYADVNDRIAEESIKRSKKNAEMQSVNFLIALFNLVGIICICAFMLRAGSVDVGTVVAVVALQNSSNNLFLRVGGFFADLQNALAGAVRVFDLLEVESEDVG